MPKFKDITNQVFGRLTVIKRAKNNGKKVSWLCLCSCGKEKSIISHSLISGNTKSCGCLQKEKIQKISTKHGLKKHPLYATWVNMRSRCNNKNNPNFESYGGRGIFVCKEWDSFLNFLNNMGNKPSQNHTLDRINNNKGYSPDNCKWSTSKEQCLNRRTNNIITYNNISMTLTEWAELKNIKVITLSQRLGKLNWSIEDAITRPVKKYNR